jgi:leucyl aminopeptidase
MLFLCYKNYKKLVKSDIADLKNTGGRFGGAITAA